MTALVTLLGLLPFPTMASTVDIYRYSVKNNLVNLKVRVIDNDNVPIQGLTRQNFHIQTTDKHGKSIKPATIKFDLLPPERQSQPDTAYVAILLDMSGSMRRPDSNKNQKLSGAISAIETFIDTAKKQNIPIKISLVPFGYRGGHNCNHLYEVGQETIANDSPFLKTKDETLKNKLKELSGVSVCASTNLSQPLVAATSYLRNQFSQVVSHVNPENTPQPRLAVILLSDGYDATSEPQFQNLQGFLKQSPQVTVHTLGYGESLRQLSDRANCSEFIPNDQLTPNSVSQHCRLPNEDIREFLIDEPHLKDIATATGGIYKLSANADEVAKSLTDFLTTLREYEIIYRQPGADRATRHQTTVRVTSSFPGLNNVTSKPIDIRMSNFVYNSLSGQERLRILTLTTLLGLVGVFSFMLWSRRLKQQAQSYL
ncbi:MAG: VWA domain-containing protein [Scytonema sp. RU_4_4]|nr:VWA domain-containing protein [Scytonema sp. RU_4_4]